MSRRPGTRAPAALVVALAGVGLALAVDGDAWFADVAMVLAPVVAFVAGRGLAPRWSAAVTAVVIAGGLLLALRASAEAVPVVMLPLALWAGGLALRERELVVARLAVQARELEAERDAYAALSVRYERARIAAELHDVVAHAISVMVVQATAGQRLAAAAPAAAAPTFAVIGDAARQAAADLDRLAGLLAAEGPAAPPDLGLVEVLVAQAGAAGLDVALRLRGDREALRGPAAHAAHRVVQEGLTNALRYAPGAAVRVDVRVGPQDATVTVADSGPAEGARPLGLGSGRGLGGLRERVDALGGTLRAGPHGGGWRLEARLPVGALAGAAR